jgi:integrase
MQWIEKRKASNRYSERTIDNYLLVYKRFKSFIESKQIPITFESVNDALLEDFLAYMVNTHKYVNNTAYINLKKLKAFLHSIENEIGVKYSFKPIKESKNYETPSVTLDEDELQKIETLELDKHRQLVRDIFIIQTHTLLRISDLNQIKKNQFDIEKGILTVNQYKTGGQVKIPIIEKVSKILEKWNYQVPQINKQTYNKYLKEICKLAEISKEYEIVRYSGNQRIVEVKPKYELISSHTARRTGITLLIKKGVPMSMIMKISGHKKVQTLMTYVGLTDDEITQFVLKALE